VTARRLNPSLLAALLVLPLITAMQEGVVWHLTAFGTQPNLVLLAVLDWGLIRGVEEGMLWGLIGGIFLDLYSGLPFGTSSAAFVVIAGLISLGETALMRTHVLLPLVAGAIAVMLYYGVAVVVVASVRHDVLLNPFMLRTVIGVAIYSAVINPILYVGAQMLDRRLHPVARTVW